MRRLSTRLRSAAACTCLAAGISVGLPINAAEASLADTTTGPPGATAPVAALWIGDSYTNGDGGAGGPAQSASCLTSGQMGWTCDLDAEGGTGFIADGHANCMCFGPLAERFSNDRQHFSPDVIIIDAGRNDPPSDATHQAIDNYFAAVRAAWPKATIVDIIPYFVTSTTPSRLTPWLTAAAVRNHATIEDPFSRGWAGYSVSGGQAGPDHVHPTADGYRYIAEHLTADFRAMGLPAADTSAGHPAVSLASPS